jgi:hypothetical protein
MVISLDPKQLVSFEELLWSQVVQHRQAEKPNRRGPAQKASIKRKQTERNP